MTEKFVCLTEMEKLDMRIIKAKIQQRMMETKYRQSIHDMQEAANQGKHKT